MQGVVSIAVYVSGIEDLIAHLDQIGENVANRLDPIAKTAAAVVANEAKAHCPVSAEDYVNSFSHTKNPKGYLKNSIGYKRSERGSLYKISYLIKPLKNDAYYGLFIEYGTAKMAASPFMRPAADNKKNQVNEIFAQGIRQAVERG